MRRSDRSFLHSVLRSFPIHCALLAGLIAAAWAPQCRAQYGGARNPSMGNVQRGLPTYLQHAGISQNLNNELPLSAKFLDSSGKPVSLGQYFHERPIVLAQVYFSCGMLCPQVMHGAAESLKQTGFKAGKDYDIIVASFDPKDTPQEAAGEKQRFLGWLGDPSAASGVHFLTGTQPSIDALTHATGFHYVSVQGPDGKMDQFAHSSVIMVATPDGRLSKYFSGIQYVPRDLRLALVDASNHKIGSAADLFLLYCCSYNPSSGRYTVSILRVLSIAALGTIFIIAGILFLLSRKPKGRKFPPAPPTATA
jgi:protein SCO1/2